MPLYGALFMSFIYFGTICTGTNRAETTKSDWKAHKKEMP
jgi:hypothetical protein